MKKFELQYINDLDIQVEEIGKTIPAISGINAPQSDVNTSTYGKFRRGLEASSIHIPDQTTANSFHTETDGDSWWGCNVADWASDNDNANAYILKTGVAKFKEVSLTSNVIISGLQAGSAVGVEWLTAGTIASKTILLTGAASDCYIAGGAGLDYTNWHADKGFLLGIDYSDSALAKFFIGDHVNHKYFSFDGTNTDATGFRMIEKFEAGENITAGNVIRLGNYSSTTVYTSADAHIRQENPDTNYSTGVIRIGRESANIREGLFKFVFGDLPSRFPFKASLFVRCTKTMVGNVIVGFITEDWDATTVTYNTKPAYTSIGKTISMDAAQWYEVDITDAIKECWVDENSFYGIYLIQNADGNDDYCLVADYEDPQEYKTYITFKHLPFDEKIYVADTAVDGYFNQRNIIGVAPNDITSGNTGSVIVGGITTDVTLLASATGGNVYLQLGGSIGVQSGFQHLRADRNNTKLGVGISTNKLLLDIENLDPFIIEEHTVNLARSAAQTEYLYIPPYANKLIVEYSAELVSGEVIAKGSLTVYRNQVNDIDIAGNRSATIHIATIDWSSTKGCKVTITKDNNSASTTLIIYICE